jgi:hypothetical protein
MGRRSDVSRDVRSPSPGSHRGWIRHGGEGSVERGSGGRHPCPAGEGRQGEDDTYLALAPPLSVLLYWAARP